MNRGTHQAKPRWSAAFTRQLLKAGENPALSWIFQTIFKMELNIDETTLDVLYVVNSNALEKEEKFSVGNRQLWWSRKTEWTRRKDRGFGSLLNVFCLLARRESPFSHIRSSMLIRQSQIQPGFKSKHWKEFSKHLLYTNNKHGNISFCPHPPPWDKAGGARTDVVTGAGAGWWLLVFGLVLLDIKTTSFMHLFCYIKLNPGS